jgi:hypothetical protein
VLEPRKAPVCQQNGLFHSAGSPLRSGDWTLEEFGPLPGLIPTPSVYTPQAPDVLLARVRALRTI